METSLQVGLFGWFSRQNRSLISYDNVEGKVYGNLGNKFVLILMFHFYRVPKLTLGIECTLYLLQAIVRDEEMMQNPGGFLSENDLRLMYSTAIIR